MLEEKLKAIVKVLCSDMRMRANVRPVNAIPLIISTRQPLLVVQKVFLQILLLRVCGAKYKEERRLAKCVDVRAKLSSATILKGPDAFYVSRAANDGV